MPSNTSYERIAKVHHITCMFPFHCGMQATGSRRGRGPEAQRNFRMGLHALPLTEEELYALNNAILDTKECLCACASPVLRSYAGQLVSLEATDLKNTEYNARTLFFTVRKFAERLMCICDAHPTHFPAVLRHAALDVYETAHWSAHVTAFPGQPVGDIHLPMAASTVVSKLPVIQRVLVALGSMDLETDPTTAVWRFDESHPATQKAVAELNDGCKSLKHEILASSHLLPEEKDCISIARQRAVACFPFNLHNIPLAAQYITYVDDGAPAAPQLCLGLRMFAEATMSIFNGIEHTHNLFAAAKGLWHATVWAAHTEYWTPKQSGKDSDSGSDSEDGGMSPCEFCAAARSVGTLVIDADFLRHVQNAHFNPLCNLLLEQLVFLPDVIAAFGMAAPGGTDAVDVDRIVSVVTKLRHRSKDAAGKPCRGPHCFLDISCRPGAAGNELTRVLLEVVGTQPHGPECALVERGKCTHGKALAELMYIDNGDDEKRKHWKALRFGTEDSTSVSPVSSACSTP